MFVRRKKNKSGSVSIQIIDKSSGSYRVYRTVGSSYDTAEIEHLNKQAGKEIEDITGQQKLPYEFDKEKELVDTFFDSIENFKLLGPELVLGKLFDEIGFNKIPDELFRHLVITRLVYPVSKLKTVDYFFKYKGIVIDVVNVYRYYDVTTLYFEAAEEDDFRQTGFSKDGRHQQPQIVLGLLVSTAGYPLAYELFEGSKFEGHTMIPVIDAFKEKYRLGKLILVADAGLMSAKNIKSLCEKNYEFILGARIKNETKQVKQTILSLIRKSIGQRKAHKTGLTNKEVIQSYKSDLRIRPIYHYRRKRIEAHVCIAFAACKLYKELERQLYKMKAKISPEEAINSLFSYKTYTITYKESGAIRAAKIIQCALGCPSVEVRRCFSQNKNMGDEGAEY